MRLEEREREAGGTESQWKGREEETSMYLQEPCCDLPHDFLMHAFWRLLGWTIIPRKIKREGLGFLE